MKLMGLGRAWLAALLLGTTPLAWGASAALERGLAVDIAGTGRDSIVFRTEDGDGFAIFRPSSAEGGFDLFLYPGQGPGVDRIVAADLNGDSRRDLVALRADGSTVRWLANDGGTVARVLGVELPVGHTGHHMSPEEIHALHAAAAARDADPGFLASVNGGASTRIAAQLVPSFTLPKGFAPRLAAKGRFGAHGETTWALVGAGSRPRLLVVEDDAVREVPVPFATAQVTVASIQTFAFDPETVNIQPGDTVQWTWAESGHNVVSGASCVNDNQFCSPNNTNCNASPLSNLGATYSRVFPSAGTFDYFCRPHCESGMTGRVIVGTVAAPGTVPDGNVVPGTPLRVNKGVGGSLDLSWAPSCTGAATEYAAYQGTLPITGTYTHAILDCTLGATGTANVVPGGGNRYYLVVPQMASIEGNYGVDRINGVTHPIPAAATPCKPQNAGACP